MSSDDSALTGSVPQGLRELGIRLWSLDHLITMREEPDEIESELSRLADLSHRLLAQVLPGFSDVGAGFAAQVLAHFLEFVFLVNWGPRSSVWRVSRRTIIEFSKLVEIPGAPVEFTQLYVFQILRQFYQLCSKTDYEADYERFERFFCGLISTTERRLNQRDHRESCPFSGSLRLVQ